jgi:transcriptional regulator with XRE-family HTH domain
VAINFINQKKIVFLPQNYKDMKTIISKNLKKLREINGYTQDQIANYLKINRSTYSNYESGDRETPIQILEKIADLYGYDLIWLFENTEEEIQNQFIAAFRIDEVQDTDMNEIANFKKIIKNYLKMDHLLKNGTILN